MKLKTSHQPALARKPAPKPPPVLQRRASVLDQHLAVSESPAVEALPAALAKQELLHQNELVILLVKPSLWLVPAESTRFAVVVALLALLAYRTQALHEIMNNQLLMYVSALLIGARLLYSVLGWISHTYLLTNYRIITVKGARKPEVFHAPLCKINEVAPLTTRLEAALGLGTLGFRVDGHISPAGTWVWIANPDRVQLQIESAIKKWRR